ncbi:MAG: acetyl-CoA carboxylase biotin carboxyl carrier protein [Acetobacteraceae bacterium]
MSRIEIDEQAIRRLARLLDETGLAEIEIAEGESRIRVVRAGAAESQAVVPTAAPAPAAPPVAARREAGADATHPGAILSPMVGVAYLSPEPGAPPFVKAGDVVSQGQTLMLIEAMKTFNQIKAPRAGTVGRILVESGSPVEYGEVLLILD